MGGWGEAQCREAGKSVLTHSHAEGQLPFDEARGTAGLAGSAERKTQGLVFPVPEPLADTA